MGITNSCYDIYDDFWAHMNKYRLSTAHRLAKEAFLGEFFVATVDI